jgi:SAM-dependent methyltransferase
MTTHQAQLAAEWTRVIAPRTRNVRAELIEEAAEFLGITIDEASRRLEGAGERFREEWTRTVTDPTDAATLTRFYNQSDTELFELIEWHATDPIHYRTLVVRDFASRQSGRAYLDYGSGIGNDALVFAEAGFEVTLADISDCLLAFATWRCRRRGLRVRAVDLKKESPPNGAFDVAACFDVLEHIPRPIDVVRRLHASLRHRGLLAIHAPFADDSEHPMHVIHRDIVTPRMRSLGFQPVDCAFPAFIRAPQVYEKRVVPALDRAAYYLYDNYLNNALGARLAALYRRRRRPAVSTG